MVYRLLPVRIFSCSPAEVAESTPAFRRRETLEKREQVQTNQRQNRNNTEPGRPQLQTHSRTSIQMELFQMDAGAAEEFGGLLSETYTTLQTVDLDTLMEVINVAPLNWPPELAGVHGSHPLPVGPSHMGQAQYPPPWTAAPEPDLYWPAPAMTETCYGPLAPDNWQLTPGSHLSYPQPDGASHMGLVDLAELPPPWTAAPEFGFYQPAPAMAQTCYGPLAAENWQLPALLDRQTGASMCGQVLPDWARADNEATLRYPAVPATPHNKAAKVEQPVHMIRHPRRILTNRKAENVRNTPQPYVKKPPNAFMLFMKEQRPEVVAEYNITNNSDVNKILGKLWKSMTPGEQAPYYDRASEARRLHDEQNPDWSFRDNYGKKRKRERGKAFVSVTASAPGSEQNAHPGKRMCLSSLQAGTASDSPLMSPVVVLQRLRPHAPREDTGRRSACYG